MKTSVYIKMKVLERICQSVNRREENINTTSDGNGGGAALHGGGGASPSAPPSVGGLLDDVRGEGVVAGDADGVAGERVGAGPGPAVTAAGQAEEAEGGEEDLAVGGRHQVVEDGVDGRADVEQHVGHHVEVVVKVVEVAGRSEGQRATVSTSVQSLFHLKFSLNYCLTRSCDNDLRYMSTFEIISLQFISYY